MTINEKNRLDTLEERIESLERKMENSNSDIKQILFYLHNDDATNSKGMVENISILKETVNELIKREEVYKGKATVWGIVGSVLWSGIVAGFWFVLKALT